MTKPKTEKELQDRVLDVLRPAWQCVHLDDDKDYRLVRTGPRCEGYVRPNGYAFGLIGDLGSSELAALAEASRLLRDGIEGPTKIERALIVLRSNFPDARYEQHKCPDAKPRIYVISGITLVEIHATDPVKYAMSYQSKTETLISPHGVSLINIALDILNEETP